MSLQEKKYQTKVSVCKLSKRVLVSFVTVVKISRPSIKQYLSPSSPAIFLKHLLLFQKFETDLSKASLLLRFSIFRCILLKHGDLNQLSQIFFFLAGL